MIKTSRVFIIIGMVFGGLFIYPIVLGVIALKKIDQATNARDLIPWGIVSLILVNTIGGILLLCASDDDLKRYKESMNLPIEEVKEEAPVVEEASVVEEKVEEHNATTKVELEPEDIIYEEDEEAIFEELEAFDDL